VWGMGGRLSMLLLLLIGSVVVPVVLPTGVVIRMIRWLSPLPLQPARLLRGMLGPVIASCDLSRSRQRRPLLASLLLVRLVLLPLLVLILLIRVRR
jgi:hypothetical protein